MQPETPAEAGLAASAQLDAVREVLRAISRSPFDLEAVLAIVVVTVMLWERSGSAWVHEVIERVSRGRSG